MYRGEVFQDIAGAWRWRVIASNGRIVATSGEGYVNRSHAEDMLAALFTPGAVQIANRADETF